MKLAWKIQAFPEFHSTIKALTVDDQENMYVLYHSGIWKIDSQTKKPQRLTHQQDRDASYLDSITLKNDDTLYACSAEFHWIYQYSISRNVLIKLKEVVCWFPRGFATDRHSNLYVTDLHHIFTINANSGTKITIAGMGTSTNWKPCQLGKQGYEDGDVTSALFDDPRAITVTTDGIIYVADRKNHCIRKIEDGVVSTVAGIPGVPGYRNGPLSDALLSFPNQLVVLANNKILVLDASSKIRKIDLEAKTVSTEFRFASILPPSILTQDRRRNLYVVDSHDRIFKYHDMWQWERFLWLAQRKEDSSYCNLASLPLDLVRLLSSHLHA